MPKQNTNSEACNKAEKLEGLYVEGVCKTHRCPIEDNYCIHKHRFGILGALCGKAMTARDD